MTSFDSRNNNESLKDEINSRFKRIDEIYEQTNAPNDLQNSSQGPFNLKAAKALKRSSGIVTEIISKNDSGHYRVISDQKYKHLIRKIDTEYGYREPKMKNLVE